ncbi:MAG: type II toxin-antitoxin system VapC family toxin [Chloroflexota bacterium]
MVFADTSFWIALGQSRDGRHHDAQMLWRKQIRGVVTSNHVRGEAWTFINRRYGHQQAVQFLDVLERSARVEVVSTPPEIELDAIRWLRARNEREYSFVDATSFALMRWLDIQEALAFDGDFSAAGFVELRVS